MTQISIDTDRIPQIKATAEVRWAPVFLSAIINSPERLVIGVIATSKADHYIAEASDLNRLRCLYATASDAIEFAAHIFFEQLRHDLATKGADIFAGYQSPVSAITLGEPNDTHGISLKQVADTWLAALSSLHDPSKVMTAAGTNDRYLLNEGPPLDNGIFELGEEAERLPAQIYQFVEQNHAAIARFFSESIRQGRARRVKAHAVKIDFHGQRLVANFGNLSAQRQGASVDRIKRQLWDLAVYRDQSAKSPLLSSAHAHELIVYHQVLTDPLLTDRQSQNLSEALGSLEEQADKEEIRLKPMTAISAIGAHLYRAERVQRV